jgi:plasmid maintenance system killer protein
VQIERVALRKLTQLDRSCELLDLRLPPGNRLEALKGDRKGQQSIGSMTNGVFASAGTMATPTTQK